MHMNAVLIKVVCLYCVAYVCWLYAYVIGVLCLFVSVLVLVCLCDCCLY